MTRKEVVDEKLVKVKSSSETVLYDRQGLEANFAAELEKKEELQLAYWGTRDNFLLTHSVFQKIENFKSIFDWFRINLVLIHPDSQFKINELFFDEDHHMNRVMNLNLRQLDTGISRLAAEEIPIDSNLLLSELMTEIRERVTEAKI